MYESIIIPSAKKRYESAWSRRLFFDPKNKIYGLFMSRAIEFDFSIPAGLKKASYSRIKTE